MNFNILMCGESFDSRSRQIYWKSIGRVFCDAADQAARLIEERKSTPSRILGGWKRMNGQKYIRYNLYNYKV